MGNPLVVFLLLLLQKAPLQELPRQVSASQAKGQGKSQHEGAKKGGKRDQYDPASQADPFKSHRHSEGNDDEPDEGANQPGGRRVGIDRSEERRVGKERR